LTSAEIVVVWPEPKIVRSPATVRVPVMWTSPPGFGFEIVSEESSETSPIVTTCAPLALPTRIGPSIGSRADWSTKIGWDGSSG